MNTKHFFLIFLLLAGLTFAVIPTSITVHGKLTNAANVSQTKQTINMTFAIYNVATSGSALYTKSNVNVTTDYAGVYSYELSGLTLPFNESYFLGVIVANDSEMTPRINLSSSGYAYRANVSDYINASGVQNAPWAGVGACTANQWAVATTTGAPTCLQPGFTNISGTVTDAQMANQKLNATDQRYNDTAFALSLGNWSANQSSYYNKSQVEALGNLTNYYNKTASDGRYIQNGSSANLSSLTVTGGNINVTIGNVTYVDRNGKTRSIQDTTQGMDEMKTDTLLDKSRSSLTCSGSKLNYTLVVLNGQGEFDFNGTFYGGSAYAISNATITLLNGTNTTPKTNHVHFYLSGGVPTLTTTEAYPSYDHIDVATFVVGETVNSSCVVYAYSRNRYEIDTFITRVLERFEKAGTLYESGFTPTAATKNINISAGYFFNGIFEMYSNTSLNSSVDGFYFINSSGNFLQKTTFDSNTFSQYQTGETVTNNRYLNVVWGVVPTSTTAGGTTATVMRLVAVVQSKPGTEYTTTALAEQDSYGMSNFYPSNSVVKNVFTPIARTVVLYATGGGGTGTLQTLSNGQLFRFIGGAVSSSGASPSPGTSDHSALTNLAWSTAGHTMDTALNMNTNAIANASSVTATNLYGNLNASYIQNPPWLSSSTVYNNLSLTNFSAGLGLIYNNTAGQFRFNDTYGNATYYVQGTLNNLSLSQIVSSIGNWSSDKPNYVNTTALDNASIIRSANTSWVSTAVGNWSLDKSSYWTSAITATLGNWSADKSSYTNTTGIPTLMGNTTIARTGSCAAGQAVQNTTTGGVQCVAVIQNGTAAQFTTLNVSTTLYAYNSTNPYNASTYQYWNSTCYIVVTATGRMELC